MGHKTLNILGSISKHLSPLSDGKFENTMGLFLILTINGSEKEISYIITQDFMRKILWNQQVPKLENLHFHLPPFSGCGTSQSPKPIPKLFFL